MTGGARAVIGVLGGMGPAATADFYAKLVSTVGAASDRAHPPVVIWADPTVPDRVASVVDGTDAAYPRLLEGARRLVDMGATLGAMPCNTAHHYLERLVDDSGLPFVDMVDEAIEATIGPDGPVTTALLGTAGTIASQLYQRRWAARFGADVPQLRTPDPVGQEAVAAAIALVKGGAVDSARPIVQKVVDRVRDEGAQRVLLGCTELPLAWGSRPLEPEVLDATLVLAAATWREYRRQAGSEPPALASE